MKIRRLLLTLSISFGMPAIAIAGCIVADADSYPNGDPRPSGGSVLPPDHQGGAGGTVVNSGTGGNGGNGGAKCGNGMKDSDEACDDGNQADGDGCNSTCTVVEECWSCPTEGMPCTPLPPAPNATCNNGTQVCDGKGGCGECVPKEMACDKCKNCGGSVCDEPGDCDSLVCENNLCRSAIMSTCGDAVECATNFCLGVSPTCTACDNGLQCKSMLCDAGRCRASIGEPCDAIIQCVTGLTCSDIHICKADTGVPCAGPHQCLSNSCVAGTCVNCTKNTDCGGFMCTNGACPLATIPEGSYCVNSVDCATSNCAGFPRRCMP